jgi:acetyltransferase-like isoleucine patch superfamily enzyme
LTLAEQVWLPDLYNDRVFTTAEIGRGSYWDPTTRLIVHNQPAEKIVIGRYCAIAAETTIMTVGEHTTDTVSTWPFDNFMDSRPNPTRSYRVKPDTSLGSDVWLGRASLIGGGAWTSLAVCRCSATSRDPASGRSVVGGWITWA